MFKFLFSKKPTLVDLYDRQMRIKGLDQEIINKAKIGVIGCGASGSHSAIYSAHVGIGHIRLCDFDSIEAHNVPRMLGVSYKDVGRNKAKSLAKAIKKLGSGVEAEAYVDEAKTLPESFFEDLDAAMICVDRISTRFEVGEILWSRGIPHIDIGIRDLLLNVIEILPGREEWPCMFCMRQVIPENQVNFSNRTAGCDEAPIPTIQPPAAIASSFAVNEILKLITNFKLGEPLNNILQINLRSLVFHKIRVPKDTNCPICRTIV